MLFCFVFLLILLFSVSSVSQGGTGCKVLGSVVIVISKDMIGYVTLFALCAWRIICSPESTKLGVVNVNDQVKCFSQVLLSYGFVFFLAQAR